MLALSTLRRLVSRSRTMVCPLSSYRRRRLLSRHVLPRSFASFFPLPRILARQTKLHTVCARLGAVALGPQLIALIARPTDALPNRLLVLSVACLSILHLALRLRLFLRRCLLCAYATVAIAVPMARRARHITIERLLALRLLLHLLERILRALGQRV